MAWRMAPLGGDTGRSMGAGSLAGSRGSPGVAGELAASHQLAGARCWYRGTGNWLRCGGAGRERNGVGLWALRGTTLKAETRVGRREGRGASASWN